jgi:ankyrin repeat protein
MIRCDQGYSGVSLQFASKDDISIMSSEGARLINAATDNDMGAVKAFLKNDVDVNARDWDNITALMASAGKGHYEMVKHLVAQGADVDMLDKDNITALTEAVMGGHLSIIQFLADSGASVDPIAASGVSPLWLASGEGYLEIVNFLLSRKANPDNARSDGELTIQYYSSIMQSDCEAIVKGLSSK